MFVNWPKILNIVIVKVNRLFALNFLAKPPKPFSCIQLLVMKKTNEKFPTYSMVEVKKHSTPNDCWMVIENNIYNVTDFIKKHPGGKVITSFGGCDATDAFYAFHGERDFPAWKYLKYLQVGVLDPPLEVPEHIKEFRKLRKEFSDEGLFNASFLWFSLMLSLMLLIYSFGLSILWWFTPTLTTITISALIVGISYGQGGFLQHDVGHNCLFKSVKWNLITHVSLYSFLMGGSADWWKGRHNRHHASPNHNDIDLDIRTLPLFAWDKQQFKKGPKTLKWQTFYWSILGPPIIFLFYRIINTTWIIKRRNYGEIIGTILHFAFFGFLITRRISLLMYFYWLFVVLVSGGGYLGWIFALNHYMFPIYRENEERDWIKSTCSTTQNITPSLFKDWLTGHLDYQVEHHLFPRMPRHNYEKIHPRLVAYLKKYNIDYYEKGFFEAIVQVFETLSNAIES